MHTHVTYHVVLALYFQRILCFRKYIWYVGTDNVSIRTYVIHFEFRLLNTLILHSFLVIMKLEALSLVPHQDLSLEEFQSSKVSFSL